MYEDYDGVDPISPLVRKIPRCFSAWLETAKKVSRRGQGGDKEGTVYSAGSGKPGEGLSSQDIVKRLKAQFFQYLDTVVDQQMFG